MRIGGMFVLGVTLAACAPVETSSVATGSAIGTQTLGNLSPARYDRSGGSSGVGGQDYDCGDFGSAAEAQRAFIAAGGPYSDPYGLDLDGDGAACEWRSAIRRPASYRSPATVVSAPRRLAASDCFVGPRGGTYTITASGKRNYGGC